MPGRQDREKPVVKTPERDPEEQLAIAQTIWQDTALYRSLNSYGKEFHISEDPFLFSESDYHEMCLAAQASLMFHHLINRAYFESLAQDELGRSGPVSDLHHLFDQALPTSNIETLRANPNALPLICRDDLLILPPGASPRFMIGESEGAKLTAFGAAVVFDQIRDSVREHPDLLPGIASLAATHLKAVNNQIGNAGSPILGLIGDKDGYHLADYASFIAGLRANGLNAHLVREADLRPEMITPEGIYLPELGIASRLILNHPNTERLAEGSGLAQTPVRRKLLRAYASDKVRIAIPPKSFLGLKVARALVHSQEPEVVDFLSQLAGGCDNLNLIRRHIPKAIILTGEESPTDLSNCFIKNTGRSGEGGVVGPGQTNHLQRALFLEDARGKPPGAYTAEEAVATQRQIIKHGGKPFISQAGSGSREGCYLRISVLRVNDQHTAKIGSILITGRHNPHVHATPDSIVTAGSLGRSTSSQVSIQALPKSETEIRTFFINHGLSDQERVEETKDKTVLPLAEVGPRGTVIDIIRGILNPHFEETVAQGNLRDQIGDHGGLRKRVNEVRTAVNTAIKGGLIQASPSRENRGVIELSPGELESVYRVTKWWLEAQLHSTKRNKVGREPVDNITLLERVLANELTGQPTNGVTIICPGYASLPGQAALAKNIARPKSEPLRTTLSDLINGENFPRFNLLVAFAGSEEMMPNFQGSFEAPALINALDLEHQEVADFFQELGPTSYLAKLMEPEIYVPLRNELYHRYLPAHPKFQRRLKFMREHVVTSSFYRRLAQIGLPVKDIDHYIRYRDASYAATAVMFGCHQIDLLFNTEGPVWRWAYGAVADLLRQGKINQAVLPASPASEIWAAGDHSIEWEMNSVITAKHGIS